MKQVNPLLPCLFIYILVADPLNHLFANGDMSSVEGIRVRTEQVCPPFALCEDHDKSKYGLAVLQMFDIVQKLKITLEKSSVRKIIWDSPSLAALASPAKFMTQSLLVIILVSFKDKNIGNCCKETCEPTSL